MLRNGWTGARVTTPLVISPSSYNRRAGLAVCCPATSQVWSRVAGRGEPTSARRRGAAAPGADALADAPDERLQVRLVVGRYE
jgi:mRNA-degrading endonuclease toxin of MazEF toxin-antitoxin module